MDAARSPVAVAQYQLGNYKEEKKGDRQGFTCRLTDAYNPKEFCVLTVMPSEKETKYFCRKPLLPGPILGFDSCPFSATTKQNLKQHDEVFHQQLPVLCTTQGCTSFFSDASNRRKHLNTMHVAEEEKKYRHCPVEGCEFRATNPSNVARHTQKMHGFKGRPVSKKAKQQASNTATPAPLPASSSEDVAAPLPQLAQGYEQDLLPVSALPAGQLPLPVFQQTGYQQFTPAPLPASSIEDATALLLQPTQSYEQELGPDFSALPTEQFPAPVPPPTGYQQYSPPAPAPLANEAEAEAAFWQVELQKAQLALQQYNIAMQRQRYNAQLQRKQQQQFVVEPNRIRLQPLAYDPVLFQVDNTVSGV